MDNLHCTEYLSESPSTSATNANLVVCNRKRKAFKANTATNASNSLFGGRRVVLAQISGNRKRSIPSERLNTAQWPSVLPLPDKTIHQDDRCIENMLKSQEFTVIHNNYFVTVQKNIKPGHRQQAVEWLFDVCKEEQCEPDVFPLAVTYIDRFLSVQNIFRENLQALASVCLFISSKVKAPQPLNANQIAYYTDGGVKSNEILSWELLVLTKLNWDVSTSTAFDFLDQVAARYSVIHSLGPLCRTAVHRLQFKEKFAFLMPSIQASLCLLYSAFHSKSTRIIAQAEYAIYHVLHCDPKALYGSLPLLEKLCSPQSMGHEHDEGDIPQNVSFAPTLMMEEFQTPISSPLISDEMTTPLRTSLYVTPEHLSQASDDSGFNSGYSSPAAGLFDQKVLAGHEKIDSMLGDITSPQEYSRGTAPARLRSFEQFDSGVIISFHPTEQDFLAF